jgi:hypothetical protein
MVTHWQLPRRPSFWLGIRRGGGHPPLGHSPNGARSEKSRKLDYLRELGFFSRASAATRWGREHPLAASGCPSDTQASSLFQSLYWSIIGFTLYKIGPSIEVGFQQD